MSNWLLRMLSNDLVAVALSAAMLAGYQLFLRWRLKRDPLYTVQAVNALARAAWVEDVMAGNGKAVLAVQTLRNSMMGPSFLASTAILLIMGTLTLSTQSEVATVWDALYLGGGPSAPFFATKLILLLFDFFAAFFAFTMAIRMFMHVGYMINVPPALRDQAITPRYVSFHLNRGGRFYSIGMRAYYYSVPLVFWLFGPLMMLAATVGVVLLMQFLDRAPHISLTTNMPPSD